ncbi:hypothetical protein EDC96DRAFT_532021 [Choanephora cucurbitarum]|nr:hypothetical protein EDC96DRAFT_532021 [Choanephora cucurbitarum]
MLKSILISVALSILCVSAAPASGASCSPEEIKASCKILSFYKNFNMPIKIPNVCTSLDPLDKDQQSSFTNPISQQTKVYSTVCEAAVEVPKEVNALRRAFGF